MTILIFTEEELEWIDKIPYNWKIKKGCPDKLKKSIDKKLKELKKEIEKAEK